MAKGLVSPPSASFGSVSTDCPRYERFNQAECPHVNAGIKRGQVRRNEPSGTGDPAPAELRHAERTVRYLGVDVDDALEISTGIDL
jgi:hypothetical protein